MSLPVTTILDMWAAGHSAGAIVRELRLPRGVKSVQAVLRQARLIGDKRSLVIHIDRNGRMIGKEAANERLRAAHPQIRLVHSRQVPATMPTEKPNDDHDASPAERPNAQRPTKGA